ncbi:MAG: FtsB family cell division protein [Flavobacteriales bacterium]
MKRIPAFLKNKYILLPLGLLVHLFVFEEIGILQLFKERKKLNNLRRENSLMIAEIEESKSKLKELTGNKKALEKFARETYRMKKANEEVFVVLETE